MKENRDTVTGRRAQNALSWLLPSAHHRPVSPSLKEHRGMVSDQETKVGAWRKGPPPGAAAWSVPGEPLFKCETHEDESNPEHLSD